jgi:hypothetical protein
VDAREDALRYWCPTCSSAPDAPCVDMQGKPRAPHADRAAARLLDVELWPAP